MRSLFQVENTMYRAPNVTQKMTAWINNVFLSPSTKRKSTKSGSKNRLPGRSVKALPERTHIVLENTKFGWISKQWGVWRSAGIASVSTLGAKVKLKENKGPLERAHWENMEKGEVFSSYFSLGFYWSVLPFSFWVSRAYKQSLCRWSVTHNRHHAIKECINQLDIYKSMGPDTLFLGYRKSWPMS